MKQGVMMLIVVAVLVGAMSGCGGDDERLVRLAEQANQQQAEQNAAMAENTRAVAEGSKALIEAETQSRNELIFLQQDLREDQAELGRQRDVLDHARRSQAAAERRESLLAPTIVTLGLILACLAPLIVAGFALVGLYVEPTREESEVVLTELWLELRDSPPDQPTRIGDEEPQALPHVAEAES